MREILTKTVIVQKEGLVELADALKISYDDLLDEYNKAVANGTSIAFIVKEVEL